MEKAIIEKYIGERVFIILKNHFKYTFDFKFENIQGNSIFIIDKFNQKIAISIDDIALIKTALEDKKRGRKW